MNNRPKLALPMTTGEMLVKALSGFVLACLFFYLFDVWNKLPETVPTHFNTTGKIDGWGGKVTVWTVPVIGFVLFAMLSILERFPHKFNLPVTVTEENAPRLYLESRRLLGILNFEMILFFALVSYEIVQAAFGQDSMKFLYIIVFLIVVFGTIGISIYRMVRIH